MQTNDTNAIFQCFKKITIESNSFCIPGEMSPPYCEMKLIVSALDGFYNVLCYLGHAHQ